MKNYKLTPYKDCCYHCNYFVDYDPKYDNPYCKCQDDKSRIVFVSPLGICDDFDDEIRGN